jgi:hypothetical protein
MAKVGAPVSPGDIPADISKAISFYSALGVDYARLLFIPPNPDSPAQLEHQARIAAAIEGWRTLRKWKQNRWTICAYRTFGSITTYDSIKGKSGLTMYITAWMQQATQIGHQPVSPCSRRVTDPGASPFDYTP